MAKKKTAASKPLAAPDWMAELGLSSGCNVAIERIAWDWPEMLVRNAVNLIDGHKGTGKSSVMATLACAIANGTRLPESRSVGPKGACLWFGSEEHFGGSVVARWLANGGRKEQINTVLESSEKGINRVTLPFQEDRLREIVQKIRARVIVVDPYTALGDVTLDTRHEQSTRTYLESLSRIAHEEHVTVLLSRHLRKGSSGGMLEHGLGSVTIAAVCRSVLRVERDQQNPNTCYLACVSCNHGKASGVVPYTLVQSEGNCYVAQFGKRQDREMQEVLEGADEPDERDKLADARVLLTVALKNGPVDAKTLIKEALDSGIGERTLRKCKAEMGVVSKRLASGKGVAAMWQWSLRVTK